MGSASPKPAFLVIARDKNRRALPGAVIEFVIDGQPGFKASGPDGRGSLERLPANSTLEIRVSYKGQTQIVKPAKNVDSCEVIFDVDAHPELSMPGWAPAAGLGFAVATAVSLFYLMIGPSFPPDKKIIFNVWIAFCVAASGAFLGGTAHAKGKLPIPFMKGATPVRFSAVGGIAIFVVVFLLMMIANH